MLNTEGSYDATIPGQIAHASLLPGMYYNQADTWNSAWIVYYAIGLFCRAFLRCFFWFFYRFFFTGLIAKA